MELVKLNSQNLEGKLIEGYDTLIWTERFATTGDFVLETGNIEYFLDLLPEQTYITLRDTTVPMIVETHRIERKKNQPAKLTITGRSFESVLDRRVAVMGMYGPDVGEDWVITTKTPSDLATHIIAEICIDGVCSLKDQLFQVVEFLWDSDFLASTGPWKDYQVSRGNLLAVAQQWLASEYAADPTTTPPTPAYPPHGLRAIRPPNPSVTKMGIQIYHGLDRTGTIRFDATRNLLDDGTYLFSKVGSANVAYGIGDGIAAIMHEGGVEPAGLDRRVTLIDASDAALAEEDALTAYMSVALAEASETALFDGSINPDLSPYLYGRDYGLGDLVKVVGDYGLEEVSRVTEYIRSQSAAGYKAYPTLTTVNSPTTLGGGSTGGGGGGTGDP